MPLLVLLPMVTCLIVSLTLPMTDFTRAHPQPMVPNTPKVLEKIILMQPSLCATANARAIPNRRVSLPTHSHNQATCMYHHQSSAKDHKLQCLRYMYQHTHIHYTLERRLCSLLEELVILSRFHVKRAHEPLLGLNGAQMRWGCPMHLDLP